MILGKAALSTAIATSLIAAPVLAQQAPVQPAERTSAAIQGENLGGFGWGWVLAIAVIAAVIVIIASRHNNNTPASP